MEKKHIISKIANAIRLSVEIEDSSLKYSCGKYSLDDFETYWEQFQHKGKDNKLEMHCLECPRCFKGLKRAREIHEETEKISKEINDDLLIEAANDLIDSYDSKDDVLIEATPAFIERYDSKMEREYLWAAAPSRSGGQGEAYGIAVTGDGELGTLIECNAWVGNDEVETGKLELWGMQVEGTRDGVPTTGPLDILENKLEGIFRVNPIFQAFHLDRRYINVDLKERILKEANSLSLSIVMAIIHAIHQKKGDSSLAYSADIRQDGKLEKVGQVKGKLKAAKSFGIKKVILSKENQQDCPPKFLAEPDFQVLFFDNIEELLSHFDLLPASYFSHIESNGGQLKTLITKSSTTPVKPVSHGLPARANEWDFILKRVDTSGIDMTYLSQLFPYFEDLCQIRSVERSFSTVFIMGLPIKINSFLPASGIDFINKQPVLEISENLINLSTIVNGIELGFVVDKNGIMDSIRKVNIEISGRQDIGFLQMGANHRYACISYLSESLIFFFPPPGRSIHIFYKGNLIGKYLNGRWKETRYDSMEELLRQASYKYGANWSALKKAARSTISMAEKSMGGIFAFIEKEDEFSDKWEARLESYYKLRLTPLHMEELNEEELINIAKDEGATIIDKHGNLIACHAYFSTKLDWKPGMSSRHQHACHFSKIIKGIVIVASRYGTVTLYKNGEELIRI